MAPTGAQLYRIFVIVARNDPGKGAADPWNDVVHAWADRYGDPATADGTRSGDRLTDPLTGQMETLEAGQNKQGWGEVTISPKPTTPAPALTAARPGRARPRCASAAAASASPPRAPTPAPRHPPAPAGPATDRVQEVRMHLAATGTALGNSFCHDDNNSATLLLYEGAPEQGGQLVGAKRVRRPGRRRPRRALGDPPLDAPRTGRRHSWPASTAPRLTPAPPRRRPAWRWTWRPRRATGHPGPAAGGAGGGLAPRRPAGGPSRPASGRPGAAALAGDQPGARAALTALRQQVEAARGRTVSGYTVSRLNPLVDALLAQPAIAGLCLRAPPPPARPLPAPPRARPAPPAPPPPRPRARPRAPRRRPGRPGAGDATPAVGTLPPCLPDTATGTASPTPTPAATGTASPTPAGTPPTATPTPTPGASGRRVR